MKDFFTKISCIKNFKTIIVSTVVVLVLAAVALLVFKDFKLISGKDQAAEPLPHSVACDDKVFIGDDILYNRNRSQKDIKNYIDSLATGCIKKEMFWSIQGFLMEVYNKYPGKIDKWLKKKDINSIQLVQALIIPLDTEKNRKKYEKYIKKFVKDEKQLNRYMGFKPIEEEEFVVKNPGHIKFLWGRYFTFGDTKYIDKIVRCTDMDYPEECYLNAETQDMAKATLISNSQRNEEIKNYLVENMTEYRKATQKTLMREVLGVKDNNLELEKSEKIEKVSDKAPKKKK